MRVVGHLGAKAGDLVSARVIAAYPGARPLPRRRHPVLRFAVIVGAGIAVGAVIGWKLPVK
jgi:hypothetical protein